MRVDDSLILLDPNAPLRLRAQQTYRRRGTDGIWRRFRALEMPCTSSTEREPPPDARSSTRVTRCASAVGPYPSGARLALRAIQTQQYGKGSSPVTLSSGPRSRNLLVRRIAMPPCPSVVSPGPVKSWQPERSMRWVRDATLPLSL